MDSKERMPNYGESILSSQKMKCSLDVLEKCLHELKEEVKKEGIAEIDFYITDRELEKEFKREMYKYYGIPRI